MSKEIFHGRGVGRGTVIGGLRSAEELFAAVAEPPPSSSEGRGEVKPERVIVICGAGDDAAKLPTAPLLGAVCHQDTVGVRRLWEMGIPLLIIDTDSLPLTRIGGKNAILDAANGRLTVDPDLEALEEFSKRIRQRDDEEAKLLEQEDLPSITLSGRQVSILTRVSSFSPPASASSGGILLDAEDSAIRELSEEEQYETYKRSAPRSGRLLVRTLTCPEATEEAKETLKRQLRALLRASAEIPVAAVLSGVSCPEEARRRQALLVEAKNELRYDCIPVGDSMPCGILLSSPKAAMLSDLLAVETEFFLFDTELLCPDSKSPWDRGKDRSAEATLRLFEVAARGYLGERSARKRVLPFEEITETRRTSQWHLGICGALACDESFLSRAVSLGADFVALPPSFTARAKSVIRETK